MILSQVGTFATYTVSALLLPTYLDIGYIFELDVIMRVLFITFVSWFPLHLIKWAMSRYDPSENEKLMKQVRRKR